MKKLLGISLIAILTAGPAFADVPQVLTQQPAIGGGADDVATTDPTWKMVAATEADASTVATTSYVKGAYNAGLKATNKIHERVGNLSNLDESLVEKNNQGEITSDITDAINAVNTKAVNAQTAANSKLSAGDITEGNTAGAIKVGENTVNVHGLGGAAFTGVEDIVNNVKTGLAMPTDVAENGYDINAKTLKVAGKSVINEDMVGISETGKTWIHEQVHNEAGKSAYSDDANAYGAGTLGKKVQDLATAVSGLGDTYATKDGVAATVNSLNFTGTVTANAVWGSEDTTDIDVTMTKDPATVTYQE